MRAKPPIPLLKNHHYENSTVYWGENKSIYQYTESSKRGGKSEVVSAEKNLDREQDDGWVGSCLQTLE